MKRLILLVGLVLSLSGIAWAQGLTAHSLDEDPALYQALRTQTASDSTQGGIVIYVWDGECESCNITVASLGADGVFAQMQRDGIGLYKVNLSEDKKKPSSASFVSTLRVARAPTFLFFKDGKLKKRLSASTSITPESFRAALSLIR